MKKILFLIQGIVLLAIGISYGQAKINPDTVRASNAQPSPGLQWSRNFQNGKPVYYMYDPKLGKSYAMYTGQYANYVFLGKQEAAALYQPIGNYLTQETEPLFSTNGVPYRGANQDVSLDTHGLYAGTLQGKTVSVAGGGLNIYAPAPGTGGINFISSDYSNLYGNLSATSAGIISSSDITVNPGQKFNGPLNGNASSVTNGVYTSGAYSDPSWLASLSHNKIAYTGTHDQYIDGTGAYAAFPSLNGYVPYIGATSNVNLGAYNLTANSVTTGYYGKFYGVSYQLQGAKDIRLTQDSAFYYPLMKITYNNSGTKSGITMGNNSGFTAIRQITFRDKDITVASTNDPVSTFTNDAGYLPVNTSNVYATPTYVVSTPGGNAWGITQSTTTGVPNTIATRDGSGNSIFNQVTTYNGFTARNNGFTANGYQGGFYFYDRSITSNGWAWYANNGYAYFQYGATTPIMSTNSSTGAVAFNNSISQGTVTSSLLKANSTGQLVAAVSGTDYAAPGSYVPYTGASNDLNLGNNNIAAGNISTIGEITSSSAGGRFGGWWNGSGYNGAAAEVGFNNGSAYLLGYNRSTSAYIPVGISASTISLATANSDISLTVPNSRNISFSVGSTPIANINSAGISAVAFIKPYGTSNQYLMADGSTTTVVPSSGNGNGGITTLTTSGSGSASITGNTLNIPTPTPISIGAQSAENQHLSSTNDVAFNSLILKNGLGINVNSIGSGYMFDVQGRIHTTGITVNTTGYMDRVFNKDYRLRSLEEVNRYIEANHHLPEMPSEKEIVKDGMDLAALNKVLAQKVEELTLYMINKDKELKAQELRIKKLERKHMYTSK